MDGRVTPEQQRHADACIRRMTDTLVREFDPVRVILFGSRARGDARLDSDADLLVVVSEHLGSPDDTELAMLAALSRADMAKDIVALTPGEAEERRRYPWDFVHAAFREGRVLYER